MMCPVEFDVNIAFGGSPRDDTHQSMRYLFRVGYARLYGVGHKVAICSADGIRWIMWVWMNRAFEDITVAIVARNAQATITRAVQSALAAGARRIILVDDASSDQTAEKARAAGGDALRVIHNDKAVSLGFVRSLALANIETRYGIWLDADDAFGDDHMHIMRAPLAADTAELVVGAAHLYKDPEGVAVRPLDIPFFMMGPGAEWRSFERNWYPALTIAFKTEFARTIDYDPTFACAEDYDFLLRAIAGDARLHPEQHAQYQYYHSDNSVSRQRDRTALFTARALAKHAPRDIAQALKRAGFASADRACILASAALFCGDFERVPGLLDEIEDGQADIAPFGMPAADVATFYRATAALKMVDFEGAYETLATLRQRCTRADVLNNLAVATGHLEGSDAAAEALVTALEHKSDYLDARLNLQAVHEGKVPDVITMHPLRAESSRDVYVR